MQKQKRIAQERDTTMSDGMNKVILLGNLGTDPEVRYTSTGTAVMHFRMATNESFLDRNREIIERTEWHSIVMFGPRAEGLSRVLSKGTCLIVEGALRTSSYDKDGSKRYRTEVHAREVYFASAPQRSHEVSVPVGDLDENFVPADMPPIPDEPLPAVMEERSAPAPSPSTRAHRGRRAAGSSHRAPPAQAVESYPF